MKIFVSRCDIGFIIGKNWYKVLALTVRFFDLVWSMHDRLKLTHIIYKLKAGSWNIRITRNSGDRGGESTN